MATPARKTRAKPALAAAGAAAPKPRAKPRTPRSHHYHVYVIELSDEVWNVGRFRRANPDYLLGQPFVYVGMTGLDPDLRFDRPFLLAMANAGPGTNGSQFFITVAEPNWLNGRHTIFGEVVEGSDVVTEITKVSTDAQDRPHEDIVINSIEITR